ncbi:hypothetical protein U0070_013324, partial [Myodes glareolus]
QARESEKRVDINSFEHVHELVRRSLVGLRRSSLAANPSEERDSEDKTKCTEDPHDCLQSSVNIRELLEGEITEGDVKEKDTEKRNYLKTYIFNIQRRAKHSTALNPATAPSSATCSPNSTRLVVIGAMFSACSVRGAERTPDRFTWKDPGTRLPEETARSTDRHLQRKGLEKGPRFLSAINFPNELGSIGMGLNLEGSLLRPTT